MKKQYFLIPIVVVALVVVSIIAVTRREAYAEIDVKKQLDLSLISQENEYDIYSDPEDNQYYYLTGTDTLRMIITSEKNMTYVETMDATAIKEKAKERINWYSNILKKDDVMTQFYADGIMGYEYTAYQQIGNSLIQLFTLDYDQYGNFISGCLTLDAYVQDKDSYVANEITEDEAIGLSLQYIQDNLSELQKLTPESDYFDFLNATDLKITVVDNTIGNQNYKSVLLESNAIGYTRGCKININAKTREIRDVDLLK